MKKIDQYKNPFDAILEFEEKIAEYTGSPYCITTDSCTHAIEISFRILHDGTTVRFPCRTYLSVPMNMHKLNIDYELIDIPWKKFYRFEETNIYDSARHFEPDMYIPGSVQCLSFGRTKPLQIGRGGAILTDDKKFYTKASRMRSDGRDLFAYKPWADQVDFEVGYHYNMKPEECIIGINLLDNLDLVKQIDEYYNYSDCRLIKIKNT